MGLLAGISSWAFQEALHFVTNFRVDHDWLLFLLSLACTVMAIEIFGTGLLIPALIGCVAAFAFSNHRVIYKPQHIIDSEHHNKSDISPKLFNRMIN